MARNERDHFMKSLEVRCCCIPQKLLGWLIVEDDYFNHNNKTEIKSCIKNTTHTYYSLFTPEIISLPLKIINFSDKTSYLAINSNDISIEKLRLIKNFVEFKEN